MSAITRFYLGEAGDTEGRRLDEILAWDDAELEEVHDYIQWLFPTPTHSAFNPHAPVLADQDVAAFRANKVLQSRLRQSFMRFLQFAGLTLDVAGQVTEGENFKERSPEVWAHVNHNWLRVSRVLLSLRTLGLTAEAQAFFDWLDTAYRSGVIGGNAGSRSEAAESYVQWTKHAQGTAS